MYVVLIVTGACLWVKVCTEEEGSELMTELTAIVSKKLTTRSHMSKRGWGLIGVNLSKPHTSKISVYQNIWNVPFLCTLNNGLKWCFKIYHRIMLCSPQTTKNNEFLFKNIVAMYWTHQIASCHWPYHRGLIAKIIGSPNKVCTVNHATEVLQWRLQILQIRFVWSWRIYSEDYWWFVQSTMSQSIYSIEC